MGSTPLRTRKCAAARLDMCALDPAPSVTLIAVTRPRSASARATSSEGSVETGGESSAVITKLPPRRRRCSSLTALPDDCSCAAKSILLAVFRIQGECSTRPSAPAPLRVDASHELRRESPQPLVVHASASGHVVVREAPRLELHFLGESFVPVGARV